MSFMRNRTACASLMALCAAALTPAPVAAADYFAGKSIDMLVGAAPGGGYDIYARAVARHIGDHIPGHPAIVVKNMPGAGSARAAGFISAKGPKDGSAMAGIMPGAIMGPILDPRAETLFDPTKVVYVGTANNGTRVCVSRSVWGIEAFDDVLSKNAIFGGISTNDSTRDYGYMFQNEIGAKYKLVTGYAGTADLSLAVERKEVDGVCGWDWASVKAQHPDWLRDRKVHVLLQIALDPNEELDKMGVPHVWKYLTDPVKRKVVELVISQQVFQRSYIMSPDTPAEVLKILRTAFDETMQDKAFLDDAEKIHIDIAPLSGAKVEELVHKLYATPKDIIDKARKAINP